jgi:uncharacterized protein YjbI with pentapeptide repeats
MTPILSRNRILQFAAAMFPLVAFSSSTHADIYQWEYINPADPSQGKQQSTTLAPDGAGVDAVPGSYLAYRNLTMGYLIGADLTGAYLAETNLTDADLSQANLVNAYLYTATLTEADFTSAEVQWAGFSAGDTGLTAAQLYSTASYTARNLTGIHLGGDLIDWNFAGQNLTNASVGGTLTSANFREANLTNATFAAIFPPTALTDADFTGAEIRGAIFGGIGARGQVFKAPITLTQLYSTASYKAHDLSNIGLVGQDLAGGNFADQNLTNGAFDLAALTDADFTGADLSLATLQGTKLQNATLIGAHLFGADLSPISIGPQSSAITDLTGAKLNDADLRNANFTYAYLTSADFTGAQVRGAILHGITLAQLYSTASYQLHDLPGIGLYGSDLSGGNFVGQNLTNAFFSTGATVTGADFSTADVRGALNLALSGGTTTNLILPDGHISGLDLHADDLLVVHDHDGRPEFGIGFPPIPIAVDQHLSMGAGGTLRMVFDADSWDSTISFAPGIPVTLGGTLELTFADDVNPATQLGHTFDLFDWTGVDPTGEFEVSSPYRWDTSNLYTTGEVRLLAVPEPRPLITVCVCVVAIVSMHRSRPSTIGRVIQVATRLSPLMAYSCAVRPDILSWHSRAIHEVLRDEAEALIGRG